MVKSSGDKDLTTVPPTALTKLLNLHLVPVAAGSLVGTETPFKWIRSNCVLYQHPGFSVKSMCCPVLVFRCPFFPPNSAHGRKAILLWWSRRPSWSFEIIPQKRLNIQRWDAFTVFKTEEERLRSSSTAGLPPRQHFHQRFYHQMTVSLMLLSELTRQISIFTASFLCSFLMVI